MIELLSLTQSELSQMLLPLSRVRLSRSKPLSTEDLLKKEQAQARYRAKQLFHWIYQKKVVDFSLMTDLSGELRGWLSQNARIFRPGVAENRTALDGTQKLLWKLDDGKTIESVIIPAALQEKETADEAEAPAESLANRPANQPVSQNERYSGRPLNMERNASTQPRDHFGAEVQELQWKRLTACISSQVGCAMACKFCLTGVQGLDRSLAVHEIVAQVLELRRLAPITNIVFMGMGEPLHNLDAIAQACKILLDPDGLGFSKRKVTVSTSGLVPAIDELGKRVDVSLAISLNASNDEQRSQIMPVNRKWNIASLLQACRRYPLGPHRRITFEYVLLKDFNDSLEDAARVAALLRGIPSKVNLIPFNEHSGSEFKRPVESRVTEFQQFLMNRGFTATVRISRGRDILAACGQLRSIFGTARGTDRHRDWAPVVGQVQENGTENIQNEVQY